MIAKDLIESVTKECEIKNFIIEKEFSGSEFKGTVCTHPFLDIGYNHDIPMLEAEFVTIEQINYVVSKIRDFYAQS